jgi:hypothetical protein
MVTDENLNLMHDPKLKGKGMHVFPYLSFFCDRAVSVVEELHLLRVGTGRAE